MGKIKLEQRVRYPPFEPKRFSPDSLPIASSSETIARDVDPDDIADALKKFPPSFHLGSENDWLVEQRYVYDGEIYDDSNIER